MKPEWLKVLLSLLLAPVLFFAFIGMRAFSYRNPVEAFADKLVAPLLAYPGTRILQQTFGEEVGLQTDEAIPFCRRFSLTWERYLILDVSDVDNIAPAELCEFYRKQIENYGFRTGGSRPPPDRVVLWSDDGKPLFAPPKGRAVGVIYYGKHGALRMDCTISDVNGRQVISLDSMMPSGDKNPLLPVQGRRIAVIILSLTEYGFTGPTSG